jgi:hypothetical protein
MARWPASTRACHEHAPDRPEQGVALQELQVAGELLDPVDLAPALDLDGHRPALRVPAQQVDRPDVGRVLAADQPQARGDRLAVGGEQLLEVRLDAVLPQAGIDAEVVARVRQHVVQRDRQRLALGRPHGPDRSALVVDRLGHGVGRVHPVERLVGAPVGVHGHAPVGLDHDQPGGEGQVRHQPPRVVDGAVGDDQAHRRRR